MRAFLTTAIGATVAGCVVVDDRGSWGSSSSSDSSTWTPPEGQLEVAWRIGSVGCEAAGIATVEVDLGGRVTAFPCEEELGVVTVPAGRYPVELRGLDPDGITRYEGAVDDAVRVEADALVTAPSVVLTPVPARIHATWYFEDGRLCSANGVHEVEVDLFDDADVLTVSATDACDTGAVAIQDVAPGSYVLLVLGRSEGGEVTHSAEAVLDLRAGDRVELDFELLRE